MEQIASFVAPAATTLATLIVASGSCSVDEDYVKASLPLSQFCTLEPLEPDQWPAR